MSRVHSDYPAPQSLGFVLQKAFQLGERPGVQPAFRFPTTGLDPSSNIRQILNDDRAAGLDALNDPFGEDVIAIPSEPLLAAREAAKAPFGTLRAVGLQSTPETEAALDDFAPLLLAEELPLRGDGGTSDAEIDAEGNSRFLCGRVRECDDDVQGEAPLLADEIGGGGRRSQGIQGVGWQLEGHIDPAPGGREAGDPRLPRKPVGMEIEAWRADRCVRAADLFALLQQRQRRRNRRNRFGGFLPCLNVKVGNEGGVLALAITVGEAVQGVSVAVPKTPALGGDVIERGGKLCDRLVQRRSLLGGGLQLQSDGTSPRLLSTARR
jgi:hypothetical protein